MQKLLLILPMLLSMVCAQNYSYVQRASGLNDVAFLSNCTEPGSNNSYAAGYYSGDLTTSFPLLLISLNENGFLIKYDGLGNVQWYRGLNATNTKIYDVCTDPSGNVYVTGTFEGSMNPGTGTITSTGGQDIFLIKYDAAGNVQWSRNAGGSADDEGLTVFADNNSVYIGGTYTQSASFSGVATNNYSSGVDGFIARYDLNGNIQWVRDFGAVGGTGMTNDDKIISLVSDGANVYAVGEFESKVFEIRQPPIPLIGSYTTINNATTGASVRSDVFIVSFTNLGAFNYVQTIASGQDDAIGGICLESGNLYACGAVFPSAILPSGGSMGGGSSQDIFLMELNPVTGIENWAISENGTATGANHDMAYDITGDGAGKLYITGIMNGNVDFGGAGVVSKVGTQGNFITSYCIDGNFNWVRTSGSSGVDYAWGVCANATNVYQCGSYEGAGAFGSFGPYVNLTGDDAFHAQLTKSSPCTCTIPTDGGMASVLGNPFCSGDPINLVLSAYSGNIQWQFSTDSGVTWFDISGAISDNEIQNPTDTTWYRAKLSAPFCTESYSDTVTAIPDNIPPAFSCLGNQTAMTDASCNYFIPDYTTDPSLVSSVSDNCPGGVSITQNITPGTNIGSGNYEVWLYFEDANANIDSCSFTLTVEAFIGTRIVSCGDVYLNENTASFGNTESNFSCSLYPTPGTDIYYQITVPSGNYLLQVNISNMSSATNTYAGVFWLSNNCPGSICNATDDYYYDISNQQFTHSGSSTQNFEAVGPGTYFLVVDGLSNGDLQYDISFDCVESGVNFDTDCGGNDLDSNGVITYVDGSLNLDINTCGTHQICNELLLRNIGFEWLDSVVFDLGNCYSNITNINPDGAGTGFYNSAGQWSESNSASQIIWTFENSSNPNWGDGVSSNYNCANYNAFCFDAEISNTCLDSTDLEIQITIYDDGSGNANNTAQSFDVSLAKGFRLINNPPTISCPSSQTVSADASCLYSLVDYTGMATVNDDCQSVTVFQSPAAGTNLGVGNHLISLFVTDGIDTVSCDFNLTVNLPDVNFTSNITNGCVDMEVDFTDLSTGGTSWFWDFGDGNTSTAQNPSHIYSDTGTYDVSLTVNFSGGCSNTLIQTNYITTYPPISNFTANPITGCVIPHNVFFTDQSILPDTWFWDFGDGNTSTSQNPVHSYTAYGTFGVSLIVEDTVYGCSDTSYINIEIIDTVAPVINCPLDQTENLDNNCQATLSDYTGLATVNDACDPSPTISQFPTVGTNFNTSQQVWIIAEDANGNKDSCSFWVYPIDNIPPVAQCQNVTVYLDAGGTAGITTNDIDAGSADNCSIASMVLSQSVFNCLDVGSAVNVDLIVTDTAGNTHNCTSQVTVLDTIKPTFICPSNQILNLDASCSATVPNFDAVSINAQDNCSNVTVSQTPLSGTTISSTTPVTVTVTDDSGNQRTCTFTLFVADNTPPVAQCQNVTVYLDVAGTAGITTNDIDAGSVDNCSIASMVLSQSAFNCSDVASPVNVNLTVTDTAGNTHNCTSQVTVLDTVSPSISCSGNITSCDTIVNYTLPGFTDNCSGTALNLLSGLPSGSDFPVGITTIVYEVTDASGNTANCSFDVEILPAINTDFTLPDTVCMPSGNIDLNIGTNLNPGETDQFYSNTGAIINMGNMLQVNLSGPGFYDIVHVVDNGTCTDTLVKFIELVAPINNGFVLPVTLCADTGFINLNDYLNPGVTDTAFWQVSGLNQDSIWNISGLTGGQNLSYIIPLGQCSDTATGSVFIHEDVDPGFQLPDSICDSEVLDLNTYVLGTSGGVFSGNQVSNNNFVALGLSGQQLISYEVGVPACLEASIDSIFVDVSPTVYIGTDTAICGDSILFNPAFSGSSVVWQAQSNVIFSNPSIGNSEINFLVEGTFELVLETSSSQCSSSDTVSVEVFFLPTVVDAGPDQSLAFTTSSETNATVPDYGQGEWSSPNDLVFYNVLEENTLVENLQIGENYLIWTITNGVCDAQADTALIVVEELNIVSGFSPNNDGKNDVFYIEALSHLGTVSIEVFNRWGTLVYQNQNYQNDWDGSGESGPLPADTYYYLIKTSTHGEFNGYVVIRK